MAILNLNCSRTQLAIQILSQHSEKVTRAPIFKKTNTSFRKKYGIDILGAPYFVRRGTTIFHLAYITDQKFEIAEYLPLTDMGNLMERVGEHQEIRGLY